MDDAEFDYFDDDGFDDLPDDALQELETTAIAATQQQQQHQAPETDYGIGDEGDDRGNLDEVINLNDMSGAAQAQYSNPGTTHYHESTYNNQTYTEAAYNDQTYNEPADSNQTYAQPTHYNTSHAYSNGVRHEQHDAMDLDEQPRRSQADPNQLLLRIKKLEQEKARLAREVQSEQQKYQQKTGETETARRRERETRREYEARIQALQQSHNEMDAKHRAELEKLRREREQAQTDNLFLEHDLAREADKTKRLKKTIRNEIPSRPKPTAVPSPAATPKKNQRNLPLRDGFDDEDMVMASPSKTRDRPKASTPKQANKRKRQVPDQSPVPALQLSAKRERIIPEESTTVPDALDPALLEGLKRDDRRFELLHRLVNSRSSKGNDRLLEALTKYALPSQPDRKLSSRVYDQLSACSLEQNVHELALRFCHIFLSVWEQCLQEEYYAPVYLLLDALHFILAYEPCSTAVALTERAVPIILASVDLVAFPIARACMNHTSSTDLYSPAQRKINSEIDVIDCLDLLHLIATSCVPSVEAATCFWQCIPIDFPLHLLRKAQPLECITRMLHILSTSHLPDSLGPRVLSEFGPEQQEKRETDLIDRLTKLLSDVPEPIPEPPPDQSNAVANQPPAPYTNSQILTLRLQILTLLTTFSTSPYGSTRLSSLRYCIGRLIKSLDAQVSSLYTDPLFPTQPLTISSINTTMKLIYHLKTTNPGLDIKSKLGVIPGGNHKYLVALTRLAFSERLVLEQGIEKEVVDAAYAILDKGLTPEEGEGLLQVFSSAVTV